MKKIALLLMIVIASVSCKSDDSTPATPGNVNLTFQNRVGNAPLVLNTDTYTNQSNETYQVSELKYIISNIVFIDANGDEFAYPQAESYFVVNEENPLSKAISLSNVAGGNYTKVRFGIGVDQSNYPLNGVNDFIPTAQETGMLWSWSAGYKFIKFEGTFSGPTHANSPFIFHIGSHGTTLDNYRTVTMDLTQALNVSQEATGSVAINLDVAKIFDSVTNFSLEEKSDVQVDPVYAPIMANNFAASFSIGQ